ncbi:hypothetical protein FKW77_000239 [Venturia effusa]|uniref:Uncharacterized protein n=1 Tax=Venturia effusa TaxID=50376 RepID=A0A517LGC0_9PEZI|nr:hypothetical protein FKW77_000239 [Venturia effusa]
MRSTTIAVAFVFSVAAFPSPKYRDSSITNALVARAPQFGPFRGRSESSDEDEEQAPAWSTTIPKSSLKVVELPAQGPPPRIAILAPRRSRLPPRQGLPPHGKLNKDDEQEFEPKPSLKFSAGLRRSASLNQSRQPPQSAPWSPPKARQLKPKSSGPAKEPPFPDAEEDDEKIKAVHRMQREPNAWELDH